MVNLPPQYAVSPSDDLFISVCFYRRKESCRKPGFEDPRFKPINHNFSFSPFMDGKHPQNFLQFPQQVFFQDCFYLWTSFQQWTLALYFTVKMDFQESCSQLFAPSSILHLGQKVTFYFLPDLLHLLGLWQTKFSCQEKMSNFYNPKTFSFATLLKQKPHYNSEG